jgi:predicted RNA-binding Zn ribbon-like protein
MFSRRKNFFYEAGMAKWQKGQSGNPGGRKRGFGDLRELARTHTVDAIGTLVQVMGDETAPHGARVSAAEALLDRGWGRPVMQIAAAVETKPLDAPLPFAAELLRHVRFLKAPEPLTIEGEV